MNAPIGRLFVLVVVLFALLVAFTSRWAVFEAPSLRDNTLNHRALLEELRIRRGEILAADGTVLARDVAAQGHTFRRTYPQGALFAQAVGYSYAAAGERVGLERSRNGPLIGASNELGSIFDQLQGKQKVGSNIVTTLDPKAQKVAIDQLGSRRGAVVALDPSTGAVEVMVSYPNFDPNNLQASQRQTGSPRFDRVTQAGYPPGSTFKAVTATAAIDSGRFTPSSTLDGRSPQTFSGVPLTNDGGESFGSVDLTEALTKSINTVWAQVAVSLGKATMAKYMKRFGFYAKPPLDYPASQRAASGEYDRHGRLLSPTSGLIDVARMGIGQDKLQVTPLQMAMVAAAIANGGKLMRPHMTARIVDPDGRTTQTISPTVQSTVMKPSTASAVAQMMGQVVKEGTGTAAALSGINVAGKTGTAQVGPPGSNITQPWFIAFAPIEHPKVAIAVTIERSDGGFGGTVAAPVAKAVMESLLHHG